MKVRASPRRGRLTVELRGDDAAMPPIASPEVRLKRILVPTDFSATSRKAICYAASLAKQFNAEIILLHVVQPVTPPPSLVMLMPDTFDGALREAAAKRLAEWRREIAVPTVKANVREGPAYDEIVRAAEETNTDLIIISTHGHGRLARMLIGSTTERVVRHAPCPVLVVREREHDFLDTPQLAEMDAVKKQKGERYGNATEKKRS